MTLSIKTTRNIETILKDSLRNKFNTYKPETVAMPFHTKLLGKDRLALYSFIHSLNTNFGTSIFEPVAREIALNLFKCAELRVSAGSEISEKALMVIQSIIDDLNSANNSPDKLREINAIREVAQQGIMRTVKPTKVDLFIESKSGELWLFDLKTAKPNKGNFREFKRTLLEWVAVKLSQNIDLKVNTLIAIPYNPYEPAKYSRWTMAGMLDLEYELKVADEFWDFLGGKGAYIELLDCFERVGIELRDEIDDYFYKFR